MLWVSSSGPSCAATMACAKGCRLCCSTDAAKATVSGSPITVVTVGRFAVNVPVLSKASRSIAPKRSKAEPEVMITPQRVAAPMAEITVTGTAIAIAQGDAATRTISARVIHVAGSPRNEPTTPTRSDRTSTPGIRGRAMRSASRARSPCLFCASSTRRTMVVMELSVPGLVAVISMGAARLMLPACTSSPSATSRGRDSPVMAAVSSDDVPRETLPSVGAASPARSTITSPGTMSADVISSVSAPRRTVVVEGISS